VVRAWRISGVVVIAAALPGCSNGGSASSCTNPVSAQAVTLADFSFDPRCLTAPTGSSLSVTNSGATPHTFTVKGTSVDLKLDGSASGTASLAGVTAGTYDVVCTLHPQMTATLVVS
jgi:plastocyanin